MSTLLPRTGFYVDEVNIQIIVGLEGDTVREDGTGQGRGEGNPGSSGG